MSSEAEFSDPLKVLTGFISEMNQWELNSRRMSREARQTASPFSHHQPVAEEKARILAKYCAPKHLKYANVGGFTKPPTYDPDGERILEVVTENPRRVSIYTQQTTTVYNRKCQYVLLKKEGRWWIDNKKYFDHEGKPYKASL